LVGVDISNDFFSAVGSEKSGSRTKISFDCMDFFLKE